MADANTDFHELLTRARAGDAAALDTLARTYEPDVRIAARVHLGTALRPYLDSIDLVQSVHRSLLRGVRDGRFAFTDPAGLIALTLTMVRRKIARQWRRHRRQIRLVNPAHDSQQPADVLAALTNGVADPTKSIVVREAMARLCRDLDDVDRELLELRLLGWTTAEVAHKTGHSPEALRIRLFRLRKQIAAEHVLKDWL